MNPGASRWTAANLDRAIAIIRRHRTNTEALVALANELGFTVTFPAIDSALRKNGKGRFSNYLGADLVGEKGPLDEPAPATERQPPVFDEAATNSSEAARERASRGLSPEHDWTHPVPEGHRVKGNSTLYDGAGNVDAQWVKSERDSDDPPAFDPVPEGHIVRKVSTLVDGQGKVRAQWLQAPKDEATRWEQFWAACARNAEQYKGLAELTTSPGPNDSQMCTVYPLGDPHIGMLSWAKETGQDFDLHIAERELIAAVDMLVERAPGSATGVLANVGDFFHAEGDDQRTPASGHKLDCDTRWAKITDVGFNIMRHLIDRLLQKHEVVHVVNVPGNHDPKMARMMTMWLAAVYEREPRVDIVDNRSPYIYLRHGKNLFGFAHGDGAKPEQLPGVMAADRAEDWGATEFRFWHTGHVHHQTRKEFPGCVVESHRTLAARDYWHASKGYRSGQSLSCISYDAEYGEVTRSTVDIKLVRGAS